MPNLNLDLDYFDHPKTRRLVGLLGRGAESLPIRLWCYCGKYHKKDGSLSAYSSEEIEALVDWRGPRGKAVEALIKVGFVDEAEGGLVIHDWKDHAGHLEALHLGAKHAAKKRWDRFLPPKGDTKEAEVCPPQCPPHADGIAQRNAPAIPAIPAIPAKGEEHPSRDESAPAATDRIPSPDSLGKTWNENRGNLPAVKLPMSKGRATHAKQRLREVPDLTRWAAAIRRAAASPFCRGDNDRAWLADIDFLLRPDTLAKIEEGKYDPRGGPVPLKAKPTRDFAKEIRELEAVLDRMIGEMRKNERECAEMEFAGTLTENGRANYAMLKESDIDRIRETRGELEALKQEAQRG